MKINSIGQFNTAFMSTFLPYSDLNDKIRKGDIAAIKNADDLFIVSNNLSTLLHSSAKHNQFAISRYLLRKGLNPDIKNRLEQTPFILACQSLDQKLINEFLLYNPDVNTQDYKGDTPLHKTVSSPQIADILLNCGADPYIKNSEGENSVHLSCRYPKTLKLFHERGININTSDSDGLTLFHKAAQENNLKLAKILKKYNAEINIRDNQGRTPVFYAKTPEILSWYTDNGADIYLKDKNGITIAHKYVIHNDFELLDELIKKGADINTPDKNGFPPLAYTNNLKMIKYLLEKGANPDFYYPSGNTLFHNAVKSNNLELAYLLYKAKANPNLKNKNGDLPLDIAFSEDMRTILLSSGAKLNERLYVHQAVRENNIKYLNNLLELGADINIADKKGNTPIFYAQNPKILKLLIKAKANLMHTNNSGYTPVEHFALSGNDKFVEILKGQYTEAELKSLHKPIDICRQEYNNYNSWLTGQKKNPQTVSFCGYGIKHYGTEEIRKEMNYNVQLTPDKVDEIMSVSNSTPEGLTETYKLLKNEHEQIKKSLRNFTVIIKHYNFVLKQELCKIMGMNPQGSKWPVIGIFVQLSNKIFPEDFNKELTDAMENISADYNLLTDKYYSGTMKKQIKDYSDVMNYVINGIKYVNYFDYPDKTRNRILLNLEAMYKNDITKYNNMGVKLNDMAKKYQNALNSVLNKQSEKQTDRLIKKSIWKLVTLGLG